MSILLVDDMRTPEMAANMGFLRATHWAKTYDEAVETIKNNPTFDAIIFDHDLGDTQVPERTGYSLICWLEANSQYLPLGWQVITSNPVGREKMVSLLKAVYKNKTSVGGIYERN